MNLEDEARQKLVQKIQNSNETTRPKDKALSIIIMLRNEVGKQLSARSVLLQPIFITFMVSRQLLLDHVHYSFLLLGVAVCRMVRCVWSLSILFGTLVVLARDREFLLDLLQKAFLFPSYSIFFIAFLHGNARVFVLVLFSFFMIPGYFLLDCLFQTLLLLPFSSLFYFFLARLKNVDGKLQNIDNSSALIYGLIMKGCQMQCNLQNLSGYECVEARPSKYVFPHLCSVLLR